MTLGANQDPRLGVPKNIVFLQNTFTSVENTNPSVSSIVDFVLSQSGVAVSLDPDTRHGVVEDLVVFQNSQTSVVDQNSSVLTSPDLVLANDGVTARSETILKQMVKKIANLEFIFYYFY